MNRRSYNYNDIEILNNQFEYSIQQAQDTFKAFVDAIIPRTPRLAEVYGEIMFYGALDFLTYEFLILSLNNYHIPLEESSLNRLTMMGYYSEWFGYGSTRLEEPNQRVLEFSPSSWTQVGYPGPSFSYRTDVMEYYKRRAEHEQ